MTELGVGFNGIVFPTKHRIFGPQPDGRAAPEPLVVSIDMDKFVLSDEGRQSDSICSMTLREERVSVFRCAWRN